MQQPGSGDIRNMQILLCKRNRDAFYYDLLELGLSYDFIKCGGIACEKGIGRGYECIEI